MNKKALKADSVRISVISIAVNLLLAGGKLAAGLLGNSQALTADAVHSASDVATTVIVLAALFISAREADSNHEYGHQKYESLASLVLAVMLAWIGIKIGIDGVMSIVDKTYLTAEIPSYFTAVAAFLSIAAKEVMFRFTIRVAKRENSAALKADAWHHRSDALSSVGSLIGVLFAMFGFPIADPIAGIIIAVFILKTAFDITKDAVRALTDGACDKETSDRIHDAVIAVPDVLSLDVLKTRIFGSGIYVDIEISADGNMTLSDAHHIAEAVHDKIEAEFPAVWHCMVHVNPYTKNEE